MNRRAFFGVGGKLAAVAAAAPFLANTPAASELQAVPGEVGLWTNYVAGEAPAMQADWYEFDLEAERWVEWGAAQTARAPVFAYYDPSVSAFTRISGAFIDGEPTVITELNAIYTTVTLPLSEATDAGLNELQQKLVDAYSNLPGAH